MQTRLILIFAAGIFLGVGDESVDEKLIIAKQRFEDTIERIRSGVVGELERKAASAEKKGDLKTIEDIEAEIRSFNDNNEPPMSMPSKTYLVELRKAKARLTDDYESIIKSYTKSGNRNLAKSVQFELDTLISRYPEGDALQKGSVWKGTRSFTKPFVGDVSFEVQIQSRNGKQFTGTAIGGNGNSWDIVGTVERGKIEWKVARARNPAVPGEIHRGTMKGNKLLIHIDQAGFECEGELTLVPKPSKMDNREKQQ